MEICHYKTPIFFCWHIHFTIWFHLISFFAINTPPSDTGAHGKRCQILVVFNWLEIPGFLLWREFLLNTFHSQDSQSQPKNLRVSKKQYTTIIFFVEAHWSCHWYINFEQCDSRHSHQEVLRRVSATGLVAHQSPLLTVYLTRWSCHMKSTECTDVHPSKSGTIAPPPYLRWKPNCLSNGNESLFQGKIYPRNAISRIPRAQLTLIPLVVLSFRGQGGREMATHLKSNATCSG